MREDQFPKDRKTARFLEKSLFASCGGVGLLEVQFPQDRKTARFLHKSLFAYCGGGLAGCAPSARPQDSKIPRLLLEVILRVWTTRKTARLQYS